MGSEGLKVIQVQKHTPYFVGKVFTQRICLEPSEEINNIMSDLETELIAVLVENPFCVSVDLKRDSGGAWVALLLGVCLRFGS